MGAVLDIVSMTAMNIYTLLFLFCEVCDGSTLLSAKFAMDRYADGNEQLRRFYFEIFAMMLLRCSA